MNETIQQDVVRRLVRDFEFKERDTYINVLHQCSNH